MALIKKWINGEWWEVPAVPCPICNKLVDELDFADHDPRCGDAFKKRTWSTVKTKLDPAEVDRDFDRLSYQKDIEDGDEPWHDPN